MKDRIVRKIENLHFSKESGEIRLRILKPAAYLYGRLSIIRRGLYKKGILKSYGSGCYTIAVGNLTYGGTGKTPVVIHLAENLIKKGYRVGVVNSGYGSLHYSSRKAKKVIDNRSGLLLGDEATEIFVRVRDALVYSSRNRIDAIERTIRDGGVDVCILDDAFQHLKVASDLKILVVDFFDRFGNGYCLPVGPLREPLEAIGSADIIWFVSHREYRVDTQAEALFLRHNNSLKFIYSNFGVDSIIRYENGERIRPQDLTEKTISFSGIGREERFREVLNSLNIRPLAHISFGDHHRYTAGDIELIENTARRTGAEHIITTEKDVLRDISIVSRLKNLCVLRIGIEVFAGEDTLEKIGEPAIKN